MRDGELRRLQSGRSRRQLAEHLIQEADAAPELVVGLDFAFSFPSWFLEEHDLASGRELWELAAEQGEAWLERSEPPFWGRPGTTRPDLPAHFRETERAVRQETGARPKSPFQIGGAGAVGTGSVRGMPCLLELAEAGFSVWPFDPPELPLAVEIYPRLLTGGVVKTNLDARRASLERKFPDLKADLLEEAASSSDAFDAAVSALVMSQNREELKTLPDLDDKLRRREGVIWRPGLSGSATDDWEKGEGTDRPAGLTSGEDQEAGGVTPASQLQEALVYAARLHAGQTRKDEEGTPYIAHLLGVCSLVIETGGDEDQAVAALLHDAVEDQGGEERLEEIRRRFGERVAAIVDVCTDAYRRPKPEWRDRKKRFLASLSDHPPEALVVVAADKLYNARSILRDHRLYGDDVFDRFTGKKKGTLWYYRSLAEELVHSELESWLVDELTKTVDALLARTGIEPKADLEQLTEEIVTFRDQRDWAEFHSLKNLAAALSVEAGELQELFLWEEEADDASDTRPRVAEEVADVLIYALLFCHEADLDVEAVVRRKLKRNRERYPVDQARGRSTKYTDLDEA